MATQTYDRDGAIAYAKLWWNGHNSKFPDYDNDNDSKTSDCANFVSQCMREGGKVPEKFTTTVNSYDYWYFRTSSDRTPSWTGAQSLRLFIKYNTSGYPRMDYSFLSDSQVSQLQKGDLVFALNNDGTDKANRTAYHVAMVSKVVGSTIYVYAHSDPKNDQAWGATLANTILCKFTGTIQLGSGGSSSYPDWQSKYGNNTFVQSSSYSPNVERWQTDVNKWYDAQTTKPTGVTRLVVDGKYGPASIAMCKAFQKAIGLTTAQQTGMAGPNDKPTLFNLYGQ